MLLPKSFYATSTKQLAQDLLGTFLVANSAEGSTVGRIVETEAYLFRDDPACHAHRGMTKRNAAMFGPAGRSYVYLIYGMYYCLNVVSGAEGEGEAVLIRAVEPIAGIDLMQQRRATKQLQHLCSGPGKLAQAFALNLTHNNLCLRRSSLRLHSRDSFGHLKPGSSKFKTISSTRIGLTKGADLPLRYFVADSEHVSNRRQATLRSTHG